MCCIHKQASGATQPGTQQRRQARGRRAGAAVTRGLAAIAGAAAQRRCNARRACACKHPVPMLAGGPGLPGRGGGDGDVRAEHRRRQDGAGRHAGGHVRPPDAGQPDAAQLLQPGRPRQRQRPGPRAHAARARALEPWLMQPGPAALLCATAAFAALAWGEGVEPPVLAAVSCAHSQGCSSANGEW